VRLAGYLAHMGKNKTEYKILIEEPEKCPWKS
jgi:hypothetical protein